MLALGVQQYGGSPLRLTAATQNVMTVLDPRDVRAPLGK
jgi:hypothetical protein